MREDRNRTHRQAVKLVHQHRVFLHFGAVTLTPLAQRDHSGEQVEALFRQTVFDLAAIISARFALEDAILNQLREAIGENISRNPQFAEEFFEVLEAVETRAKDHE